MRGERRGSLVRIMGSDALEQLHVLDQRCPFGARRANCFVVELREPLQHRLRHGHVDQVARDLGNAAVECHVGFKKAFGVADATLVPCEEQTQPFDLRRGRALRCAAWPYPPQTVSAPLLAAPAGQPVAHRSSPRDRADPLRLRPGLQTHPRRVSEQLDCDLAPNAARRTPVAGGGGRRRSSEMTARPRYRW